MKKIVLVSILLLANLAFAQEILDDWTISKVVIDGTEYQAPNNNETSNFILLIYWDWDVYVFYNHHCGNISQSAHWFTDDTIFLYGLEYYPSNCSNNENNIFSDQHFGIYLDDVDKAYSYEVSTTTSGDRQLTIINDFGSQAIYLAPALGLQENNRVSFTIFPNPVAETLFVTSENLPIENLTVYNLSGQAVLSENENVKELNVSSLPAGLYFIEITSEARKQIQKFVKQ
ncbi:T9SS type A sorting domain-containing protein [Ulvibacter antarcticus]|uniref:Putative secreted protein (Por secretion system target) n=1 Tax=Ulvibacter antarcticus TaxID=442714 RepID=A0A3L9YZU8_9FLAO|nr:T9SS type A sorting domain-containing protein [Ulvibacter antarcticus]RMA66231.1 putative secreted protein (Por secretion system target) [Ulvibacter antarcticus]